MDFVARPLMQANQSFKTADHLAYITYPVVNEKKLLMVVIQNIYTTLNNAMDALLAHYHAYKQISYIPQDFEGKAEMFRSALFKRHQLDPSLYDFFLEIDEIIRHHQRSAINFVRKDSFIIASDNFKLKTVTIEKVKSYLQQTKLFLDTINGVLAQRDRGFS